MLRINVIGIIGVDVKPIEIFAQIKQAQNGEPIEFLINSDGGEVEAGFEIAKMIENYKGQTIAHGHLVASIANIIYLSCKERISNPNSKFLIHPVTISGHITANAEDLENIKQEILAIEEQILSYYERKTTTPKDEIRPFFGRQTWFNGETAKNLGFATSYENSLNTLNMSTFLENIKKVLKNEAAPDVEKMDEAAPAVSNEIPRAEYDEDKARIAALEATVADLVAKFDAMSGMTEDSIANAIVNKYNASIAKSNIAAPAGTTTANNVSTSKNLNNVW